MKIITAIPVYNEESHLDSVLQEVNRYSPEVLIVNDGSTDQTAQLLAKHQGIQVITHPENRGYGAAILSAFQYTLSNSYDVLVTMDCDGQHEPSRIPVLLEAIHDADIVSGSRYLRDFRQNSTPPQDRKHINRIITAELNEALGLSLTDSFCGFKAYRREALERLHITETGWGMPLQLWVQAAKHKLRIKEVGVPRVYLDPNRAFGGVLNDPEQRLSYYRKIIETARREVNRKSDSGAHAPCSGG